MQMGEFKERYKKMFIQAELVRLLKDAKRGNETIFDWDRFGLLGALDYAYFVGDITLETNKRIERLIHAISNKYFA